MIVSALVAAPIASAQQSIPQSILQSALAELPLEIRPPAGSVYAQVMVVGTSTYVCGATDLLPWTWLPQGSQAQLFDIAHDALGRFAERIAVTPPRTPIETVWSDKDGNRVVARRIASGRLPADAKRMWTRYDVQAASGEGPFMAIRRILRISAALVPRPSAPCDQAHAGGTADMPLEATDLLIK